MERKSPRTAAQCSHQGALGCGAPATWATAQELVSPTRETSDKPASPALADEAPERMKQPALGGAGTNTLTKNAGLIHNGVRKYAVANNQIKLDDEAIWLP